MNIETKITKKSKSSDNTDKKYSIGFNNFINEYKNQNDYYMKSYENFFKNYNNEFKKIISDNINLIETAYSNFLTHYSKLIIERNEQNEFKAWDFSIFKIIKVKREEENLHSRFLLELLNTEGKHGQKDLFYKLFIKSFLPEGKAKKFININHDDYFFKREGFIETEEGKGRIDIFIKSKNIKKEFAIIIELKWDSYDSCADQIYKYYKSKLSQYKNDNLILFYLTKHGRDPDWKENENFIEFLNKNRNTIYFPISYDNHIKKWLVICMNECKSEKVKYSIEQYLNYIIWN